MVLKAVPSAQHVKAGKAGGNAPHTCRGSECSEQNKESSHHAHGTQGGTHARHLKAGRAGGNAPNMPGQ